jgi:hypothetical protein
MIARCNCTDHSILWHVIKNDLGIFLYFYLNYTIALEGNALGELHYLWLDIYYSLYTTGRPSISDKIWWWNLDLSLIPMLLVTKLIFITMALFCKSGFGLFHLVSAYSLTEHYWISRNQPAFPPAEPALLRRLLVTNYYIAIACTFSGEFSEETLICH